LQSLKSSIKLVFSSVDALDAHLAGMAELADAADSKSLFCLFVFSEVVAFFDVSGVALHMHLLWKSGNCWSLSAKV
jgi:hypothetical protein